MFDAKQLIGALMQGGLTGSSQGRIDHALGGQGLGQSGGLFSQLSGGALGAGAGGGGALGGLADMAMSMLGGAGRSLQSGNPTAIGGLGALAGALLGGGSGSLKGALGGGAMALLGSLALNALRGNQTGQAAVPSTGEIPLGLRQPADADEEQEIESTAQLILRAMISAAKADGQVDETEMQRIAGKLQEAGADAEAQQFVRNELSQPLDFDALVRAVPNNPQIAAQVYAASLLAIEVDTDAERVYLQRLAQGLGLDQGVVQNLHATLGVA